jgi:hypothetical protein
MNGGKVILAAVSDQQQATVCSAYTTIRKGHVTRAKPKLKLHGSNAAQGAHVGQFPWGSSCNVVGQRKHLEFIGKRNDKQTQIYTNRNAIAASSAVCVAFAKL